jgi:signal transduction histidine kinase
MMFLARSKINTSLKFRLLLWVWLTSSVASFFLITFQLFFEYSKERQSALGQIEVIKKTYLPSVEKSAWDFNQEYLKLLLTAINHLPHIEYAQYVSENDKSSGPTLAGPDGIKAEQIPLSYNGSSIGVLKVGININEIKSSYVKKAIIVFLSQLLKTFAVSTLLLLVFSKVILAHLNSISSFLRNFGLQDNKYISLERSAKVNDEFTLIENAVNSLKKALTEKKNELLEINKNLELEVEKRSKQLDLERAKSIESSRLASLGEMAGGIAHEINNPLAIIALSMGTLKKMKRKGKLSDEMFNEIIGQVETTVNRVTKIVTGLRNVSRGPSENGAQSIVLRDVFTDVLGLCSERFMGHAINLEVNLESREFDNTVLGDRVQLSQVLINLFSNAHDAVEKSENKWVKVEVSEEKTYQVLKIIDSGKGIPLEVQEKMFNPFFTTKNIGMGMGLGLSVSRTIITKYGGSIEIDKSCANTCFVLKLLKGRSISA